MQSVHGRAFLYIAKQMSHLQGSVSPHQRIWSKKIFFKNFRSNEQTCFLLVPKCDPLSKYRNINGSCNHLEDPQMGMYDSTFRRILPSHYSDKKKALRLGSNRKPLPLARLIRTTLYPDANHFDSLTFSGMAWGHLLAHDMGLSLPIGKSKITLW